MGLSLPARAGYDARLTSQPPREGGRFPFSRRPKAPLEPCWQSPAGRAQSLLRGQRGGGARPSGRAQADRRSERRASAAAELAQRARRGDREGALRRRRGAAADAAERDAGHNAGSALLEPTTPSERRAASGSSCRPSAADLGVRATVVPPTHARAVSCAPPCVE